MLGIEKKEIFAINNHSSSKLIDLKLVNKEQRTPKESKKEKPKVQKADNYQKFKNVMHKKIMQKLKDQEMGESFRSWIVWL